MASCTYSVPNPDASGDNLYGPGICWQAFIDWAWDAFDFDHDDWDEGFGYDDVCNNTQPLCRALSGIWCLTYSSPRFPSESYNGNIGSWRSHSLGMKRRHFTPGPREMQRRSRRRTLQPAPSSFVTMLYPNAKKCALSTYCE